MIEFTKAYKTSTGETFASLEEAQQAELNTMFKKGLNLTEGPELEMCYKFTAAILVNADQIVDILTTTPTSKPRARKCNGGSKQRKAKTKTEAPEGPL